MSKLEGHITSRSLSWFKGLFSRLQSSRYVALSAAFVSDRRGAVMVEYVVVVGTVSLAVATSIAALGPVLLESYIRSRGILISPLP